MKPLETNAPFTEQALKPTKNINPLIMTGVILVGTGLLATQIVQQNLTVKGRDYSILYDDENKRDLEVVNTIQDPKTGKMMVQDIEKLRHTNNHQLFSLRFYSKGINAGQRALLEFSQNGYRVVSELMTHKEYDRKIKRM